MDFGRLPNINHVDFTLPSDHPDTANVLGNEKADRSIIYTGCPIWTEKGWVGKIYPLKTVEKDYLHYYAKKFNTIELNTTHYRIPDDATLERWVKAVNPGFKFSPKIPQLISHAPDIMQMTDLMQYFIEQMFKLHEHLGVSFLQLPPTFGPKKLSHLLNFLDTIPAEFKLAIELRHQDWFTDSIEVEDLFQYMKEKEISTVITDVAGRRDVLHQRLTSKKVLIRFTANDLHPSDFRRLEDWTNRLKLWLANGLEEIYFFVHTPTKIHCLELAHTFNVQMGIPSELTGIEILPKQAGYVQGSLF